MTLTGTKIKRTKIRKYSYSDYVKIPDDGKRLEILNGELIMSPSPIAVHQRVIKKLTIQLDNIVEDNNLGEVFIAPFDVILDKYNIVQPDIFFISTENQNIVTEKNITDKNITGSPDLVIEVLSPSTAYNDLVTKKEIYEQFGVKEYWIIDPEKQWMEIYSLKKKSSAEDAMKYSIFQRIEKHGKINSEIIPHLEVEFQKFFEGISDPESFTGFIFNCFNNNHNPADQKRNSADRRNHCQKQNPRNRVKI